MADGANARKLIGKRLGRRLAERRTVLGWTQDQLGERVGVDPETISRFERGVAVPSLITLDALARALKTRASDLLAESSTEPTDQAVKIAGWLQELPVKDRDFAVESLRRICEHLRR